MRIGIIVTSILLLTFRVWSAEEFHLPLTNQVTGYERIQPVFRATKISKERGDALLTLLDGGRATVRWPKQGLPPGTGCLLPVPPALWISATLTNGTKVKLGFTEDGGLLHLFDGLREVNDAAVPSIAKWVAGMENDLRQEVLAAPRPCIYQVGTVDDGGTLSGIARLFYHDAAKWPKIYQANRKILKNPNMLTGNEKLTIPE